MTQVIKKGGKKQRFIPAKIKNSIKKAAAGARISPAKTRELVIDVGESVIDLYKRKKLVKTIDLRKSILGRLNRKSKSVASAWKRYEKRKKK
ncbi:unnamed protein product [marine sediment metagenome]|uniref:ATP-cone domain-containing protein n=1 Tax=marine sediment metagenome TaxID=412755 RepID=X1SL80_9ZZZZ